MNAKSFRAMVSAAVFLSLAVGTAVAGEALRWAGPDGHLLPFQTAEEVEEFLKSATIVSRKRLKSNTNQPFKVLVEKDGVRAHAVFRYARRPLRSTPEGPEDSLDDALLEIPAYRLGKLLGIDNIPPTVLREVEGTRGSLQLWIERATKGGRYTEPPHLLADNLTLWRLQIQTMHLFDSLIFNRDRISGNFLYDPAGRLWMFDHGRAFDTRERGRKRPWRIVRCESTVWEKLQQLDRGKLTRAVAPFVGPARIEVILERHKVLVGMIDQQISEEGKEQVLFQMPEFPLEKLEARSSKSETRSAPAGDALRWVGPDGQPLNFQTAEEVEEFLKTARIVSKERIGGKEDKPFKVLLEKDGVRAHAVFRDLRSSKGTALYMSTSIESPGKELFSNFDDDGFFEISAYRLGKLLGLSNIPPTVPRKVAETEGSIQLWIEEASSERKRLQQDLQPPNLQLWSGQVDTMRLFDHLIYNRDRHDGNVLIDPSWRLWMIDHTRSFPEQETLMSFRAPIRRCEVNLWERLQQLDLDSVTKAVAPFVGPAEVEAILKRRDLIVEIINEQVSKEGQDRVFFRMPEIP